MQKNIIRRAILPINKDFSQLHPVLARIYASRGIRAESLERSLRGLLPFDALMGIEDAVALLTEALTQQKRMLLIGDFDADGATSVALGLRALTAMGAKHVDFLVPNRFEFGYGLTPEIVAVAKQFTPDLIITVDNGISSVQGVDAAYALGIKVLITDHHLPPDILPKAHAIVNPNQVGDHFKSKNLAGVGVIFYVMLALRAQLRRIHWFNDKIPEPNLAELLDLVALGTIADVVPLDENNRILVYQGLARIKAGKACTGIKALLQVAQRVAEKITASDLGFALAPRLNAAGRLQDMALGIHCLMSENLTSAIDMAMQLDTLNQQRRSLEAQMKDEAMVMVDKIALGDRDKLPAGLCLYDPDWHQGVVGILAGRMKERLQRPVVCFAKVSDQELKGSARSISGLHIRDLLEQIAVHDPQLIMKFGGHAMAAGLSILPADFIAFKARFEHEVSQIISPMQLQGFVETDGPLHTQDFSLTLAELLQQAGPWGQACSEPLFDGEFEILNQQILSNAHVKCQLQPVDSDLVLDAIAFFVDFNTWPKAQHRVRAVYRLNINEFRGQKKLQLLIEHLQTSCAHETADV